MRSITSGKGEFCFWSVTSQSLRGKSNLKYLYIHITVHIYIYNYIYILILYIILYIYIYYRRIGKSLHSTAPKTLTVNSDRDVKTCLYVLSWWWAVNQKSYSYILLVNFPSESLPASPPISCFFRIILWSLRNTLGWTAQRVWQTFAGDLW